MEAMLDTGAPYFVCKREVADSWLALGEELNAVTLGIRGINCRGRLRRGTVEVVASEGDGFTIDATVFVADDAPATMPECVLGFFGCLDRLRFAIDPHRQMFYFGQL